LNSNAKLFISENFIKSKIEAHNRILDSHSKFVNQLALHEKELLLRLSNFDDQKVAVGLKALIDKKGY
jgi:hypothetical protein